MDNESFEKVYDAMAKPLDNRHIPVDPFGPLLVKILLEDDEVFIVGSLARSAMLPFFASEEGVAHLDLLIAEIIAKHGDDFYILKASEGHTKTIENDKDEGMDEMKNKRLTHDPSAKHVICMTLYHKTGKRRGLLEIDDKRVAHYGPLLPADTNLMDVKVDAKPLQ